MSREVIAGAIRGANGFYAESVALFEKTLASKGAEHPVQFPDTAYYFPMAAAVMGVEIRELGQVEQVLRHAKNLLKDPPVDETSVLELGDALNAGTAAMLSMEIITAMRYANGETPPGGYAGFLSDTIMRELGIQLVDGRMPGFAVILGPAPTNEIAVKTVRELQKRSVLSLLVASRDGRTMFDQLKEEGVEMGLDTYIVPVGPDTVSSIYVLNWAVRSALTFGGHKIGQWQECINYTKNRIFAFGLTFGPVSDDWYAVGAGAIGMGFPVISDDTGTPEIKLAGATAYEALVVEPDHEKLVATAIQTRGVKVKVEEINIPVPYAAAFEGERVRKEDMHVQFGGKYSLAFEYLESTKVDEIDDGDIQVIGPDIDSVEAGSAMDQCIHVRVAGRKMQKDFEGILERHFHTWLNHAMGYMHTGQRDIVWSRVSKGAFASGFRLRDLGTILYSKLHEEFGGIVDKVAVRIITEKDEIEPVRLRAKAAYDARDERVAGMTDESVDTYYSCTICQSYAPSHVCIITPERLGLCGAYNWLDGKASHEISPSGPNQPVKKGAVLDEAKGQWEGVNKFVYENSGHNVDRMNAYSLMEFPMTACGCFECVLAIIPEANGVMIVNREYSGMTPSGMSFSTLAGSVGGGLQTPGFLGVGRLYLISKKFIAAEGGLPRLVWMPKELKDAMRERLQKRAEEIGLPGLIDKIADETVCTDSEKLLEYLTEVGHPALSMTPLF